MRKTFSFAVAAIALGLAGCAGNGAGGPPVGVGVLPPVSTELSDTIKQVKSAVLTACGYSAPLEEVAMIVGTFVPGAGIVGTVAHQICAAVTALGVRRGAALPEVNGVVLHGYFVRGMRHGVRHR